MQKISKGVRFLFALAVCVFGPVRHAAGLDFTMSFAIPDGENTFRISQRQFNTVTGPADHQRLFTGDSVVETGVSNSFLGIHSSKVTRFNVTGGVGIPEETGGLDLN